jgi:hypothetical protein
MATSPKSSTESSPELPVQPSKRDRAQSPDRATMDPLPPVEAGTVPVSLEGAKKLATGVGHRNAPASQQPVPSERLFPSVEDDRVLAPRPGPPAPDEAD